MISNEKMLYSATLHENTTIDIKQSHSVTS